MQTLTPVKKIVLTAVCAALCVVVPMAFHAIPNAGSVFLPMHIPVLLCGIVCGWPNGFICGLIGPLVSSLLTGMPPAAMLPSMMVECCVYGLTTGLVMKYVRTGKLLPDLYISMICHDPGPGHFRYRQESDLQPRHRSLRLGHHLPGHRHPRHRHSIAADSSDHRCPHPGSPGSQTVQVNCEAPGHNRVLSFLIKVAV